eukprot:554023_1
MGSCSCGFGQKTPTDHNPIITTPSNYQSSRSSFGKGAELTQPLNQQTKFKNTNFTTIDDESDDESDDNTCYSPPKTITDPAKSITEIAYKSNETKTDHNNISQPTKSTTETQYKSYSIQQSNSSEMETDHDYEIKKQKSFDMIQTTDICKILQDYGIQIDEDHLQETFEKHKYVKKQLIIDDLCTIFNKGTDKDVTLSNIVSDLGFIVYEERKKIYDLLLHSWIDITKIKAHNFIQILGKIAVDMVLNVDKDEITTVAKRNKLNGEIFMKQSPVNSVSFAILFNLTTGWDKKTWKSIYVHMKKWDTPQYLKNIKINKILEEIHEHKVETINEKMKEFMKECKPLHRFSAIDIGNMIQWWIYNDANYKNGLTETMIIFCDKELTEKKIKSFPDEETLRDSLKRYLELIMPPDTLENACDFLCKIYCAEKTDQGAEKIGYNVYNLSLNRLVGEINNKDVDGQKFIKYYRNKLENKNISDWIKDITGWSAEDVYQISAILFRHHIPREEDLQKQMYDVLTKSVGDETAKLIQKQMNENFKIKLEDLYYKIKNGYCVKIYSDRLINMVDHLEEEHKSKIQLHLTNNSAQKHELHKQMGNNDEDGYVRIVFDAITDSFLFNENTSQLKKYNMDLQCNWKCKRCTNYNCINYVQSKIQTSSKCSLCGISRRESILIAIRNYDTYEMVNANEKDDNNETKSDEQNENNETKSDEKRDKLDIDETIVSVLKNGNFNLQCLNQNNNQNCPAILRLIKYLLIHKKYQTGKNIAKTIKMSDINDAMETNVDNKMFKQIFFNCTKQTTRITDNDMNELKQLFDGDHMHKITHLKTFLSTTKKQFATIIRQNTTKINTAVSSELYRKIEKRLLQVLQQKQFLADLDMNIIIEDYHHILNTHIEGNETTQENVFRFFAEAMHFNDSPTEHCQALHRRKQRLHHMQESKEQKTQNSQEQKEHNSDNISIWSLELYLKLSQLDIIHYHLAHSKEKRFVKLYANRENNEETLRDLKFVTELSDKDIHTYKFGIDYSYSDTCGQYYCIKEEMLFNNLHPLPFQTFQILMAKCITKHRVALKLHRNRLFCKYYKKQYNIIRNEPIGIRHVFAIVVY